GTSGKMQNLYNLISNVADTDSTVLIMGQSGTGKELVARGLHFNSNRQNHQFAAINCNARHENYLQSQWFDHTTGYYTVAVLRERLEDVPLLVNHILQKQASATGGEPKKIDAEAVDILCHYNYPGNVRELENAIERACALCDNDLILPTDLPPHIVSHAKGDKTDQMLASMPVGQTLDDFVQQQERNYIDATLQHCDDSR